MQQLTNAFIHLRLNELVNGFLSSLTQLPVRMKQEIDLYLSDYENINEYEYE